MQQFAPHPRSAFEGYYSKFTLPSGSFLALIICSVPKATSRPHMVSFTYVPRDRTRAYQRELWVEDIERMAKGPKDAFELRIPRIGTISCAADSTAKYSLSCEEFSFEATVYGNTRVPWDAGSADSTPEGLLVNFPLPLHWHVHTLGSLSNFRLNIPETTYNLTLVDREGIALAHQEKNWASSFPSAHIWIQACKPIRGPLPTAVTPSQLSSPSTNTTATDSYSPFSSNPLIASSSSSSSSSSPWSSSTSPSPSPCAPHSIPISALCLAGGHILGATAFLLSHHAPALEQSLTFAPPFAIQFLNLSPLMKTHIDWSSRSVRIEVRGWRRKIKVRAQGEKGDFFGLSSPFAEGHRKNWCAESFNAVVEVEVWQWRWTRWRWERISVEKFERASLEFGGEWYGDRGERLAAE